MVYKNFNNVQEVQDRTWQEICHHIVDLTVASPKHDSYTSLIARKNVFWSQKFMNIHSREAFSENKSRFGKVGKFGINNDRSPGYIRSREPCHYWYLSYQMLITWNMESVSSHNGKIFIKIFPSLQAKNSLCKGGGLPRLDYIGYVQQRVVTWCGNLQ